MKFFKQFHEKRKSHLVTANILLLVLMISILVFTAFLPDGFQDDANKLLLTAIFFTSIFALSERGGILFVIAVILAIGQWITKVVDLSQLENIARGLNILFFIFVAFRLIKQFVLAKKVSQIVILGSINGYLILGLVFSIMVFLLTEISADSFYSSTLSSHLSLETNFHSFTYYTFITMSTVGYGDILPVTPEAQALATLIAITGQLYIAVVIAFLVGKFAGRSREAEWLDDWMIGRLDEIKFWMMI